MAERPSLREITVRADLAAGLAMKADVPALLSAVRAVLDLHQPVRDAYGGLVCTQCDSLAWPCPTRAALATYLTLPEET